MRKKFLSSSQEILRTDYGAGSRWSRGQKQKVATIAKHVSTPLKFSLIYQFLCKLSPANTVLELGTSLGINTAYLATVSKGILYSYEGDPILAGLAREHLSKESHINFVTGNLNETLKISLSVLKSIDFVLMDANHRYEPTLDYFKQIVPKLHSESILVIADIHWSKQMKKAWQEIKNHPSVTGSIDFFECGVLFFGKHGLRNDYILEI
ncbi:class I SAM-dependent methyltransferase [Cyclobacterium sp. 1_MG-2023]|uniref:O-methyltransferase n=1 Tax=Cyclobacterium sp. 1_MG-2023 TaxID=3062681 RepID=UPI0026E38484|nr:class I SAM-dependent methyltransferase [Cyclobacterium sp. 1_MG-2023]MDO6436153.1 class I SAM-dependent methyltransferase [Cyclobacterium sp. 1_MG-2023]